jgi:type IV pilus assembly protein PilM
VGLLDQISNLVRDPAPEHVFELSEEGIAFAQNRQTGFAPFEKGTLVSSPVTENFRRPEAAAAALARAIPLESGKRRRAALILPDYCARISVIDFDSFPNDPNEQLSLVRFRLKKTLPFDADAAAVSFYAQPTKEGGKREVVSAAVSFEVMARYEALLRAANFHAGEVTVASLAALSLFDSEEVAVIAKLAGEKLTVMVVAGGNLKLFRCVAMEHASEEDVLLVIHPTLAYIEDELGTKAERLYLCGFPRGALAKLGLPTETLQSRAGIPDANNAGLLGYLQGAS